MLTLLPEPPSITSPSEVGLVKEQFLKCYEIGYGRHYPGWGARESGQAKAWLKSCPLERALALCRFYPEWKDYNATRAAHPFGLLVMRWVEVDAWLQDSRGQVYRTAEARALEKLTTRQVEGVLDVRGFAEQARRAEQTGHVLGHEISHEAQRGISGARRQPTRSNDEPD